MQYLKIQQAIMEHIQSGQLKPRQKLPSERQLAHTFNTTRITLREALTLLEAEGKIYREDRRGWFISPSALSYSLVDLCSLEQLTQQQARQLTTELISAKAILGDTHLLEQFQLAPFSQLWQIIRVRYLESRPVLLSQHYFSPQDFPTLLQQELTHSLTQLTQVMGYEIAQKKAQVRVASCSSLTALKLRTHLGAPCLMVEQTFMREDKRVIRIDQNFWRPDAVQLQV